jgi:O-antigen/teichoic acid export membrane protein
MGQSEYAFCFGNFIKEVGLRFFSLALVVYYNWITVIQFMLLQGLFLRIITMFYAFYLKKAKFQFSVPHNVKEIMIYTFFIILSGSVATLLLDIDKLMLNQYIKSKT